MKAAVYLGIGQIEVRDLEMPAVGDDEALIKVDSCAVCGSDIRTFRHGNSRVVPPQILGHEIAGQVVRAGRNVTKVKEGDRVAVGADVPCGECVYCESGMGNNCLENYAMGYQFAGGFAEYCLLNGTVMKYGPVHLIPENISYEEAALAEPLACVINGLERAGVRPGDTAVIIGAGPIGCMMIPLARLWGAVKVILVDSDQSRIAQAEHFGADEYIWSGDGSPVGKVMELTGGRGADVVFTANSSAASHLEAIDMAGHRARVNLFGGLAQGETIMIEPNKIHYKEMILTGSHGSTPRQHRMALEFIKEGKIDMKKYISHRFPLGKINDAFHAAETREGLRVIVRPWD